MYEEGFEAEDETDGGSDECMVRRMLYVGRSLNPSSTLRWGSMDLTLRIMIEAKGAAGMSFNHRLAPMTLINYETVAN